MEILLLIISFILGGLAGLFLAAVIVELERQEELDNQLEAMGDYYSDWKPQGDSFWLDTDTLKPRPKGSKTKVKK